ncbi:hypothetical protein [Clostridium carboxidivorans]|uniref:hypothetical protein n=1 Tax=Clostridium carboxidivorans TaxID=217159 RepID=UPI00069EB05D|nr:hypothetical protein [Clostridium carboxidivorans]
MNFDKEDFKAYLTMIENVISRMATNSFIVKGWTITMISAILVLAVSKKLKLQSIYHCNCSRYFILFYRLFLSQNRKIV